MEQQIDLSEIEFLPGNSEILVRSVQKDDDNKIVRVSEKGNTVDYFYLPTVNPPTDLSIIGHYINFVDVQSADYYYIYCGNIKSGKLSGEEIDGKLFIDLNQADFGTSSNRTLQVTSAYDYFQNDVLTTVESEKSLPIDYSGPRFFPAPVITDITDERNLIFIYSGTGLFSTSTFSLFIDGRFYKTYNCTGDTLSINLSSIPYEGTFYLTVNAVVPKAKKADFIDSVQSNEVFYATNGLIGLTDSTQSIGELSPIILADKHNSILAAQGEYNE